MRTVLVQHAAIVDLFSLFRPQDHLVQLAISFALPSYSFNLVFCLSPRKKSFRHLILSNMNNMDSHNNHIDNRPPSEGRKQSPPAFLDLADSVSLIAGPFATQQH